MRNILPFLLFAFLSVAPLQAETLKEALTIAYRDNPELEAARAQLRALDENMAKTNASWIPSVSGTAKIEKSYDTSILSIQTDLRTRSLGASAGVNSLNIFSLIGDIRNVAALIKAGREQLRDSEATILLNTVQAYVGVLRDGQVLKLQEKQVEVLTRNLEQVKVQFEVGELTRTDVAQSEARRAAVLSDAIAARGTLNVSRATYRRLVGHLPDNLEDAPPIPSVPENLDAAKRRAIHKSPLLRAAHFAERAALHESQSAKADLLPSITAYASYNKVESRYSAIPAYDQTNTSRTLGAQLSVPIFTGGLRHAEIRRAQEVRSQRVLELYAARRLVVEAVNSSWANLSAARSVITAAKSAVEANAIALEGVRQERAVGSRTTLDVLNAEAEYLSAQVGLVRARSNAVISAYALLAAIGELDAQSLGLEAEIYDPKDHYKSSRFRLIGWGRSVKNKALENEDQD